MNLAIEMLPASLESHERFINDLGRPCFSRKYVDDFVEGNRARLNDLDKARLANRNMSENLVEERKGIIRKLVLVVISLIVGLILVVSLKGLFSSDNNLDGGRDYPPIPVPVQEKYTSGSNLLVNGDCSWGMQGWTAQGQATLVGSNASFHIEGGYSDGASINQEIGLPAKRPGYALVIGKARSNTESADGMSGLPYLWGYIRKSNGSVKSYLSGYNMILKAPKDEWGVVWGTFELGKEAVAISISLQQALKAGGTRYGVFVEFDDLAIYLFNSPIIARKYAESYTGEPPSAVLLKEDDDAGPFVDPEKGSHFARSIKAFFTDESERNYGEAMAMYERIEIGMSQHTAGIIMEFDDENLNWSKDFGRSLKPACVTLSVSFKGGKVIWVALIKEYEKRQGNEPSRILVEKGTAP